MKTCACSLLSIVLPAALATACQGGAKPLYYPGPSDSGTPVQVADAGSTPDAAPDDSGFAPDAAPIPDAGITPARHLVDRPLFGAMPIQNLVMDPEFDLSTGNWYGILNNGMFNLAKIYKHHEAATPTDQPVLAVPKGPANVGQVFITGTAQTPAGPFTASIWIARKLGDTTASVSVSLLTVTASGAPAAADIMVDTGTPPKMIGDLVWKKYLSLAGPAVGWVHFFITDSTSDPFYISAPWIIPAFPFELPGQRPGFGWRDAKPLERTALQVFEKRMGESFKRAPKVRGTRRAAR